MENTYKFAELYGVNDSKSVSVVILNHFENARAAKTRKRLGGNGLPSNLSLIQGNSDGSFDLVGK